jgi:hypothetical protein
MKDDDFKRVRDELFDKVKATLLGAIEARAKQLHEAGYTKEDLSIRLDGGVSIIFVHNVADSKFWLEQEGTKLIIRGESMR